MDTAWIRPTPREEAVTTRPSSLTTTSMPGESWRRSGLTRSGLPATTRRLRPFRIASLTWRGMRIVVTEALGPAALFVPAEREPARSLVDRFPRRLGIAFDVGIVYAQDDRASVVA